MKIWIFALGLIFGSTGFVKTAQSQQVYSVTWPTTHAALPAKLPDTSPNELAAYRLGLAFYSESNVVNLITDHIDALGISAPDAARYKKLFGQRYQLIENDSVFRNAPSALSYCFSAERPTEGFAVVYCPQKARSKIAAFGFSSRLWRQFFVVTTIACGSIPGSPDYFSGVWHLRGIDAAGVSLGMPPGRSEKGWPANWRSDFNWAFAGRLRRGGYLHEISKKFPPPHPVGRLSTQQTVARFNQTMSVRCLAGAKEDFVQSGTFAGFMRAIQPRLKDLEFQTIPDGDHFFMLEKKEATLKVLRSWIETPAAKAVLKRSAKISSASPVLSRGFRSARASLGSCGSSPNPSQQNEATTLP